MSIETVPECNSALIVGTGLIGTSIGLCLAEQGIKVGLQDVDHQAERDAAKRGAGEPHVPGAQYDLAVVAVPPSEVAAEVGRLLADDRVETITEVASTKGRVLAEVSGLGLNTGRFVSSHPMAGREVTGPLSAQKDLFKGKAWAVIPLPHNERGAVRRVEALAAACGAIAIQTTPEEHDRSVALVSHLPHVVSAMLAAELRDEEGGALCLAGTGLPGMVRLAGGDPHLWTDILASNVDSVLKQALSFRDQLSRFIDGMERAADGNSAALKEVLQQGVLGKGALDRALAERSNLA